MTFKVPAGYSGTYAITISGDDAVSSVNGKVPFTPVDGGIKVKSIVSVTYDLDGGSGTVPAGFTKTEGDTFKLASYKGTKSGYTFGGWTDGTGIYAAGGNYTVGDKDVTLTAVWNEIRVTGISLSSSSLSMFVDESKTLTVTVNPKNAHINTVTWTSNHPGIADVVNGKVTAYAQGDAVITAVSDDNGEITASCTVQVSNVPVKSVSIPSKKTMVIGASETLEAVITPDNAADKSVSWASSNDSIVTVDGSGTLTAWSAGSATVTVTTNDGNKTANCTVTVTTPPIESISFSEGSVNLSLNCTDRLEYSVYPETASSKVTWASSNSKAVSVDKEGNIKALKTGSPVTITVTSAENKNVKATCTVNVVIKELDSITISGGLENIKVGDIMPLTATFDPEDATYRTVTWTSSDSKAASVDKNGNVKGLKATVEGESVTITVKSVNEPDVYAQLSFTVENVHPDTISLSASSLSLKAGSTSTLKATIAPSSAFDKTVVWSVESGEGVASVDLKGKVTALSKGDAVIRAVPTDNTNGIYAECTVHVTDVPIKSVSLAKSLTLEVGQSSKLSPKISPTIVPDMEWTVTGDTDAVTVDDDGTVHAVSIPEVATSVTVSVWNDATPNPLSASCTVTVKPVSVKGVSLEPSTLSMTYGDEDYQLEAVIDPVGAADKRVTWNSSKTAVATVDSRGYVHAAGPGTATITVTTVDGKKTAACTVTVDVLHVNNIEPATEKTSLALNETCRLELAFDPENAYNKSVTWVSSDSKTVSVDKNGNVKGLKATAEGQPVTVTATSADNKDAKATWTLTVSKVDVESISIEADGEPVTGTFEIMLKQKIQLQAVIDPENASYKDVVWTTTDSKAVSVDKNGNITGVKISDESTVTITATSKDNPGVTKQISVKVIPAKIVSITMKQSYAVLGMGANTTLKATYQMSNAANDLRWSYVEDEGIITVDPVSGKVVAGNTVGTATVRVTSQSTGVYADCTVYVKAVSVKSVAIATEPGGKAVKSLQMNVGDGADLYAVISPDYATVKDVVWSSSNSAVVTVDKDGHITAMGSGTAKITVLTKDMGKKVTITVKVL